MLRPAQPIRPILIGHDNGKRQTSSDSDWGDDDHFNENDLAELALIAEKEYEQSQVASVQPVLPSAINPLPNGHFSPVLPKQGAVPRQPVPRSGVTFRPSQTAGNSQQRPSGQLTNPGTSGPNPRVLPPNVIFNNHQGLASTSNGSPAPHRLVPVPPGFQQKNTTQMEQVIRENAELKAKNEHMKSNEFAQLGEVRMLRDQLMKKEEDLNKIRTDLDSLKRAQHTELLKDQDELKRINDRLTTQLEFKNQEMQEMVSRLQRFESERRTTELATQQEPIAGGLLTHQKRPAADPGGFPTAQSFHENSAKRPRRTTEPQPAEVFPLSKESKTTAAQTEPMEFHLNQDQLSNEQASSQYPVTSDSVRTNAIEPLDRMDIGEMDRDDQHHVKSYQIIHELNDSRPEVEERFTLAVLLQPLPKFEVSSSFEIDLEKKKQWDKQLSRSGRLPKKIVKGFLHNFITNSVTTTTSYPSHLIAQEAIALFVTHDKQHGGVMDDKARLSFLLGALVPVLSDHFRQYASFLHNLSSLASVGKAARNGETSAGAALLTDGEVVLTTYFTTVLANPSSASLRFVETVERNAKLALIVLRKLLDRFPELHKFVMRDMDSPQQIYSHLATMFSELKGPLEKGMTLSHGSPIGVAGAGEPILVPSRDNSTVWRSIRDQLSVKYRMDQQTQEVVMVQLVRIPEPMTKVSALKLILMLCDPLQFRVCQRSVLALSASAVAALAASVGPDSTGAKEMTERMVGDEVLINYFCAAQSTETLEPAVRLLKVLLQWKSFVPKLCTRNTDTCLMLWLYIRVFASDLPKQRVLENCGLHLQLLQCLLEIILSDDEETRLLLTCPTRHCVEELIEQFMEVLYINVESISSALVYSPEGVQVCPLVKQFINHGVLWICAMKKNTDSVWKQYVYNVQHRLRFIIVALHDENLFEYDKNFEAVLEKLYRELSTGQT